MDFSKVNVIAKFDAFPMPQVEEKVQFIGQAQFVMTWI